MAMPRGANLRQNRMSEYGQTADRHGMTMREPQPGVLHDTIIPASRHPPRTIRTTFPAVGRPVEGTWCAAPYRYREPRLSVSNQPEDASVGDELLLLPYLHQPAASPYRASGPIFVRRGARQRTLDVGEVPSYVTRRLMSLRAYDAAHMMLAASVCDGVLTAQELLKLFSNQQVEYIQLHNAGQGCFSCQVNRA